MILNILYCTPMISEQNLSELDREYREMNSATVEEKKAYCEKLISVIQKRLLDESPGNESLKELLSEMITAAEKEIKGFTSALGSH